MKKLKLQKCLPIILTINIALLGLFHASFAQQKAYQFNTGYAVKLGPEVKFPRYARTEFPQDRVIHDLLNGTLISPYDNPNSNDAALQWEAISTDENGHFNSEKFNYGGLYLEYESPSRQIMIFDGAGNDKAYINGIPREGDHFDFKITKFPVEIEKGKNTIYLTGGGNLRIKAALYPPASPVMLSTDQITLPDLIQEEDGYKWGGVMVINATDKAISGYEIESSIEGKTLKTKVPTIEKLTSRLVPFQISELTGVTDSEVEVQLNLLSGTGKPLSSVTFPIKNKPFQQTHDRTFVSKIDGSVQYFSVTPGEVPDDVTPALFLSVHGAGVQARGQAAVYEPKDWGHLVAPTNRGPFGFAWEDWGRLDALEVLEIGKELFQPDSQKIYLTGHSMGGHASWYLGATYPDYWAAIGPCAGYPELHDWIEYKPKDETDIQCMFIRGGNPQSTKLLKRNYLHTGIYIHHGDADPVVPVTHAREMRTTLSQFHPDFSYYEYPGGKHWFGKISADWPPLFEFLKTHTIPAPDQVRNLEFYTASPGVSSQSYWATIYQQKAPYQLSHVNLNLSNDSLNISGTTENVAVLQLDLTKASMKFPATIQIDNAEITMQESQTEVWLVQDENKNWKVGNRPEANQKGPHRYGNFKDAFRHNMVFVFGTGGSKEEKAWNYYKARYDAEAFRYRGNGSIEIIADKQFKPEAYADRGVIIYGNADNNSVWKLLLKESPVQVTNGKIQIGNKSFTGDDLGCYFIQPRPDSEIASVGVVSGTGLQGFKAAHANQYFVAGASFPDLTVFRKDVFVKGYDAVECVGFFGNDWSVENGDFTWK